jgi:peroxiredoxin
MVALSTPEINKAWKAEDFTLRGVDEKFYSLSDVKGDKGLVVAFICNHCPYVQSISTKLVRDATELKRIGVGFIAINSNSPTVSPDDSFEGMIEFSMQNNFNFPYVIDITQEVARKYGAVCTPDFFGFNQDLKLQYRGRLDYAEMSQLLDAKRELSIAMSEIAKTGEFKGDQIPSIGCSIKWNT